MANIVHTVQIRADTSQARSSIQDLQTQLASLQSVPITADVSGLQTARNEINQLSQSLRSAMNPTSGKLDLSVFSQQLIKSGKTLNDYKNTLFSMGTQGQQAFLSLANTIASAEAPTNRLNAKVLQFGKTLKNTINWQLSSTLIHGVVGQVNQAINYAEKLNTSLNNIQIVTGQNNERMVEFARQANKTAKELNSTTTEYTNAALIYYQQGLSDKEVAARNAVTLKMANVTRQSAQTVSDQLTAIWNNFDDGTASLEHYADVITALGAATASSSTEISTGLDKFASIGKTVGLSYDYATTALATIVATTRQSADSVGTGLRTVFSRLQGLNLGETLDDGVTLNKYSDALAKVGVNILDQYNNVKDMDTILGELGSKWQTISKEQQIALAQTVGGVRQYTTIMTLMNNWSTFQENLKIAQGADGTLQDQADRYATSWEAARKRVQTATEGIYDSLIDDQGIIGATNAFAGFLDVINGLVEGFGGLKSIIPMVLALFAGSAAKNMPQFFADIKANFQTMTGRSVKNMSGIQTELDTTLEGLIKNSSDDVYKMQLKKIRDQNYMNQSLLQNARRMSEADQAAYRLKMESRGYLWDASIKAAQEAQKKQQAQEDFIANRVKVRQKSPSQADLADAIKNSQAQLEKSPDDWVKNQVRDNKERQRLEQEYNNLIKSVTSKQNSFNKADMKVNDKRDTVKVAEEEVKNAQKEFDDTVKKSASYLSLSKSIASNRGKITKATNKINSGTLTPEQIREEQDRIRELNNKVGQDSAKLKKLFSTTGDNSGEKSVRDARSKLAKAMSKLEKAQEEEAKASKDAADKKKELTEEAKKRDVAQKNLDKKVEDLTKEGIETRARELGNKTANENAGVPDQRDFLTEAYEKAGITTSAQGLLKSLGWEFDENGRVKTAGKALTEENLNRPLTTREQGQVNAATQAVISDVVSAAKRTQEFTTTGDLLKGNTEILSTKGLSKDLLKSNIVDQVRGLQGFGSSLLTTLGLDKLDFSKIPGFQDLDEKGIWGKIAEKLDMDPSDIQGIAGKLKGMYVSAMETATDEAKQSEKDLNTAEENATQKGGVKNITGVTQAVKDTTDAKLRSDYLTGQMGNKGDTAQPSKETQLASKTMGGAQSLFMAVSAMNSSANTFKTIMDSSASGAEKFGAILSTTASLLMSFATATNFATTAVSKETQEKFTNSAFGQSGFGKTFGLGGTIGLGISIAMLVAGLAKGWYDKVQQDAAEERQNTIDLGNESIEKLSSSSTLIQSQNNLINAYNAAAKAVAEGTATEKDLINARQELITSLMEKTNDGYSNSNAVAYAYAGNMAGVQSQIDANRLLQIQTERNKVQVAADAAGKEFKVKNTGIIDTNKMIWASDFQASSYFGKMQDILNGEPYLAYYSDTSAEDKYAQYQKAIAVRDRMLSEGFEYSTANEDDQQLYTKLTNFITKIGDEADAYGKFISSIHDLDIEALTLGGTVDNETIGNANLAIKDINTYNEYRQKLIDTEAKILGYTDKDSTEYKNMVNQIDAQLGSLTSVTGNELGNLQYISTGIENVVNYQKEHFQLNDQDANTLRETLIKTYQNYGDALFSIGTIYKLPIEFDTDSLDDNLKSILELLQSTAEANKIKAQIELAANFNLDSSSTSKEWAKFVKDLDEDLWKEIFNGEEFDLARFAALPSEMQETKMQQYENGAEEKYYSPGGELDQNIINLYKEKESLQGEMDNLITSPWNQVRQAYSIADEAFNTAVQRQRTSDEDIANMEQLLSQGEYKDLIDTFGFGLGFVTRDVSSEDYKSVAEDIYTRAREEADSVAAMMNQAREQHELLKKRADDLLAYATNGKLSALDISTLTDEEKADLISSLSDEDLEKYNDLLAQQAAADATIAQYKDEAAAYYATGFRRALTAQADSYGLNYDDVQTYATELREQGLFDEPTMDYETFQQQQNDLLDKQIQYAQMKANGEMTDEEYTQKMTETAQALADLNDEYNQNIKASEEFAIAQMRLEQGIESLSSNWKTWQSTLKSTTKNSWENTQAFKQTKKAIADILGLDTSDITKDFVEAADAAGVLDEAAEGTKEGLQSLQKFAGEHLLQSIFTSEDSAGGIDITDTENQLLSSFGDLFSSLQTLADGSPIEIGMSIDQTGALGALQQFVTSAGMTADQVNALLGSMGYNPSVTTMTIPVSVEDEGSDHAHWTAEVMGQEITGDMSMVNTSGSQTTVTIPVINGSQTNYKGSGGGGSDGGGGGGKKKKDHKKPDTGTRYHKIKAQQSNNSQRMDETARKKERAFGAEKIKQAQEEITLQKEQIRLQREYVDEITDYLGDDRKQMEDSFKGLGITLDIDSDGVITNFRAVEEELLRQENSLIDQYNDGPLDDEAYAEAQKKIDDAREYLKTYEETRDLYEEQMIAMIEQMDDLADKLLELTKTKIELKIDISDDKIELLDYMLEKIEDDAYKVAEAIALIGDKTSENLERIDIYRSGLQEILGAKGFTLEDLNNLTDEELMSANFTQAEIDQIKDWRSELYDLNKELLETRETIIDKVVDAFDELNERVQDSYDKFDDYNSILEHYKNITELMSIRLNQQNKELLDNLGRAAIANAQQQASAAFNIYNEAQGRLEQATSIYNDIVDRYGPNSQEEQQYRKILEAAEEDFKEAQEEWLEAHENALKIVEEHYTATIERISKEFEQAIAGLFGTLDYLQSAFERAGTVNDEYLQDYERLYELSKLNRDIQKDIDDTNNIRSKQALRNLQAEINKLQEEGVKLSQYDIDALRKKYELEQARQALEDARNTKSEVRLQRDANGNWGYVYTSAEDEVDDAEQEYENRLYEYQKLNDEYIEELQQRALEIQQTYQEVLGEIFAPDSGLTEEERQARLDEINAWRDSELAYIQSQLENAMTNQNDLLDIYYQTYGKNWAEVADTWDETRLRMLSGFETLDDFLKNTIDAMNQLQKSYQEAIIQYQKDEEETQIAAGQSTEEWADLVGIAIGNIGTNSKKTKEEIGALSTELTDNFLISLQSVITWEQEYADRIDGATEANERFIQSLNDMIAKLSILESSNPEVKAARAAYVAAEAAHEAFIQSHGVGANDPDWEKAKSNWNDFITKYLAKFDTGGYTGSWGTEGRLAVVHEKENIFSAADTANLLDAAQILRTIDLSARTFAAGLGSIILPDFQAKKESLQQEVHIEASFPSVQDHNEIELAFDNLINKASQYANRKNMSSMTFQDMYTSKF